MLEILRTVTMSPEQWDIVVEGMRNPKNSWDRSDSYITHIEDPETLECADFEFFLGEADHALMTSLAAGGAVHAKYRRMMPVWVTINAPLYWWKEFDTYKVGTVCNSCSTMHKIHAKPFVPEDFSRDKMTDKSMYVQDTVIDYLNACRDAFLATKDRKYWDQLIQMLPTSYNQRRTIMLSYEVLVNIYESRKHHKLEEWHTLCRWIESLPHSDLIIGKSPENNEMV